MQFESIMLAAYPVGSIYMSVNSTNPGTLFGGTWERITGKFLLAATDGGAAGGNSNASIAPGNTGGEATHTLTAAETATKNHSHNYDKTTSISGGSHRHKYALMFRSWYGALIGNDNDIALWDYASSKWVYGTALGGAAGQLANNALQTSSKSVTADGRNVQANSEAMAHSHTIGTTSTATGSNPANANGSAHNNMPPYLAVYVWKRTA